MASIFKKRFESTKDINPPYWTACNAIKILYYYWLDVLKSIIIYYQDFYYDDFIGGIYYSKPYNKC